MLPTDQAKIGRFIAERRKAGGYTQVALAERLGITDRAVSKWENGRSLPDAGLMLPLCGLLDINVNELLSGERLDMDNYKAMAEENLTRLREMEELNNKKLLSLEIVIGFTCTISFMVMLYAACFAVTDKLWQAALIVTGCAVLMVGGYFSLKLERDAGYYECPHCGERYVPSMRAVVLAPHVWRSRLMKCPKCGRRGYHKKVLTR
ncbi:MAG: helix-turn-helix domain-containing protein [Clostridia bacterium]|nr:helix-turn-helix domain-containing protein [Clostridia bacterium]